jgi:uncharacterized RDD family membrane protein YckC
MKCPKCQYLGFDGHSRCRHCGYDLSLSATVEMTPGAAEAPPAEAIPDVIYRPEPSARAQARAAIQKRAASRTPSPESFDLPLFATPGVEDRPALPASRPPLSVRRATTDAPRARAAFAPASASTSSAGAGAAFAPAAAGASAPESIAPAAALDAMVPAPVPDSVADADTHPRLEARLELDGFSFAPPPDPDPELPMTFGGTPLGGELRAAGGTLTLPGHQAAATASAGFARLRPTAAPTAALDADLAPGVAELDSAVAEPPSADAHGSAAPLGPRMLAGIVDLAVLATVDAAVVLATLRATGLDWSQIDRLPIAPLAVFLVLLAIGYLAMCNVLAGRTFGKAAFGLAVVEAGGRPVRLAPAVVRALIQVLTVPAAGIGFLPALLGADRRSLYDRLAGTDVVRDARAAEDTRHA